MISEHMNERQGWAFLGEVEATRSLLGYGVETVRREPGADVKLHPILALLASGAERLYKLTLGVCAIDARGRWLSQGELQDGYRHDIVKLHRDVFGELDIRTAGSTTYVRSKVDAVRDDRLLEKLTVLFDTYAREGRYFDADILAGREPALNLHTLWSEVEVATRTAPTVARARENLDAVPLAKHHERNRALDAAVAAERNEIASSVERMWTAVAVAGENGALGDLGRKLGALIHLGRTESPSR